jgi:hypothetical protein
MLTDQIKAEIQKLEGPIVVFGAGGFIGSNLFRHILQYRTMCMALPQGTFIPLAN